MKSMKLPKQSVPVRRPDLIEPHTTVDLQVLIDAINEASSGNTDDGSIVDSSDESVSTVDVDQLEEIVRNLRFDLLHGANYNDPMRFLMPVSFCGCQILSGQARARCSAACGWF